MVDPSHQRKPYVRGVPNTLPPQPHGDVKWGPHMAALDDRARTFVLSLFSVRQGHGAAVRAAKEAGYGTNVSSPASWASIASRLIHDPNIMAAIREHSEKFIRHGAPRALTALMNLIEDPTARDHARAIGMLMDRVYPTESHHTVDVQHTHIVDHTEAAVADLRIMKGLGVPREKLVEMFGYSGLPRYEDLLAEQDRKSGRVIEGVAEAVEK
jgi:phage terminase small subunit